MKGSDLGIVNSLINKKVKDTDVGNLANEIKDVQSQLDDKLNQNSILSMANMGQDIKEAMTGGSVAVVGDKCVNYNNLGVEIASDNSLLYSFGDLLNYISTWKNYDASKINITNNKIIFTSYLMWIYKINPFILNTNDKIKITLKVKPISCNVDYNRFSFGCNNYSSSNENLKYIDIYTNKYRYNGIDYKLGDEIEITLEDVNLNTLTNPHIMFKQSNPNFNGGIEIIDYKIIKYDDVIPSESNMKGVKFSDWSLISKKALDIESEIKNEISNIATSKIETMYNLNSLTNTLQGKTWAAVGDSLTATWFNMYVTYIQEQTNLISTNYGIGGTCVAQNPKADVTPCFVDRICGLNGQIGYTDNYDLWTIFGGTNDALKNTPIGNITSLDNTTFYGAYNNILNNLLSRNNHPTIVLITPYIMGSTDVLPYRNAILEIGVKYGLKVIDLYKESQINKINTNYYLRDGVHPNQYAVNIIRPYLLQQFRTIILPVDTTPMPH